MPFLSLLLAAAPLGAPTDRAAAARAYADASGVTPPTHGARAECLGYWPAWVKPQKGGVIPAPAPAQLPAAPRLPPAGNVASDFRASLDDPDAEQRGVEAAMRAGSDAPGKALEGDDVAAARLSSMLGGCRLA